MKSHMILLFAVSPFAIGYLLNFAMQNYNWYGMAILVISLLFAALWFAAGYKSYDYSKSKIKSVLLGNFFAIVSIVLILFQVGIHGRFMPNIIGILPQIYFLPILSLALRIERLLFFFTTNSYMQIIFALCFILMAALYYAGYSVRQKRISSGQSW